MRIGLVTDSLGHLSFDEMLETASGLGIQTLEFGCGGGHQRLIWVWMFSWKVKWNGQTLSRRSALMVWKSVR
jgi:hypothetical protein